MNDPARAQALERKESAAALDLLEHPGWKDVMKDVAREAKAARGILLGTATVTPESMGREHAAGSFAVLKNVVMAIYRRANKEVPAEVSAMFE